jgi:hypothetical protein
MQRQRGQEADQRRSDVNYVYRWMHEGVERSIIPLIQAAVLGHANVMSALIEMGADVNKPEPCNGNTAPYGAAQLGSSELPS